jgi:hypothetical protein
MIYDPRYHTFDSWACLMVEQYAGQQLEIPGPTTDWREWATGLKSIALFSNDGVPGPEGFEDWSDWATALLNSVTT